MSEPLDVKYIKLPNYSDVHHTKDGHFTNEPGDPLITSSQEPKPSFSGMKTFFNFAMSNVDVTSPMPIRKIEKDSRDFQISDDRGIKIWWLGHLTVLIRITNKYVITDPILTLYASPISSNMFKRVTPSPISIEDLPKIDYILYSHDHYDHLSYETLTQLKKLNPDVKILAPLGVDKLVNGWDKNFRVIPFDWRVKSTFDEITFTCFPARHFSKRTITDFGKKLWCSWLIQFSDVSIYFAGDSAVGPHFREVRNHVGKPIDLALMPIGPQNPSYMMRPVHMNPMDVKSMSDELEAKVVVPIHYGTFALGCSVETPDLLLLRKLWNGDNLMPLITGGCTELNLDSNDEKFSVCDESEMLQPSE